MEITSISSRRRGIERTSSNASIPPQITSRRDSLFGNGNVLSETDDDYGYGEGDVVLSTAHLYPPNTPRRRFHRRNGLCQFQLLQDAVHTAIDENGLAEDVTGEEGCGGGGGGSSDDSSGYEANDPHSTEFHTPSAPSTTTSSTTSFSFSSSYRTRKVSLPMIHEAGAGAISALSSSPTGTNHYYTGDDYDGCVEPSFTSGRKLSRTCFRPNPSSGSIYTEESTL